MRLLTPREVFETDGKMLQWARNVKYALPAEWTERFGGRGVIDARGLAVTVFDSKEDEGRFLSALADGIYSGELVCLDMEDGRPAFIIRLQERRWWPTVDVHYVETSR